MEDKMNSFSNKSAERQVGENLAQVRILASKPNLTPFHVLLAAIEATYKGYPHAPIDKLKLPKGISY
jgi:hypothetical protein